MLLGYNFPEKGKEMNKNIPKFSLLYSSPYFFDTHALAFYYKNLLHK